MKYLFLFLPFTLTGQSFPELIALYEKECAQLVNDTITQYGTISYDIVPVIDKGKIVHYALGKADTVWQEPTCKEFKYPERPTASLISGGGWISLTGTNSLAYTSGPITGTEKSKKTEVEISRKYVCKIKLREVEPFSEHFWKWIKALKD